MRQEEQGKLFLFGRYSLAVLLPKKWLTKNGLGAGDRVKLKMNGTRHRIVMQFEPSVKIPEQVAKLPGKSSPSTHRPKFKDKLAIHGDGNEDSWQPLPPI